MVLCVFAVFRPHESWHIFDDAVRDILGEGAAASEMCAVQLPACIALAHALELRTALGLKRLMGTQQPAAAAIVASN